MIEAQELELQEAPTLIEEQANESSRLHRVAAWGGKLAALAGLSLGAGVASAAVFPSEVDLGPHRAEVALSFDSAATLDFGAPGSIIMPIDNYGIGADIEIKEIPGGYPEGSKATEFTAEDVEEYARLFSTYETDIDEIKQALQDQILRGALTGTGVLTGLYLLIGSRRREELADSAVSISHTRSARAAVATMVMAGALSGGISGAEDRGVEVSPAFDGTMLEGARIEGKILQVLINQYGTDVLEYIEKNETFYDMVSNNLLLAYESGSPLRSDDSHDLMLYYTDLHCNIGMGGIIGEAAHLFDIRIAVSGGDDTMSGTDIEEQCIRAVASALGDITRVVSTGNHDSSETEEQLRRHGFVVLDGEPTDVAGYRFIGDDDPRRSVIGQEMRQERQETVEEMAARLTSEACLDSRGIDVVLAHDPDVTRRVLRRGCADTGLSGHTHHGNFENILDSDGHTLPQLTGDSAGGAEHDRPTLGPLQADARLYILRMNKTDGTLSAYQAVALQADGSVDLELPIWVTSTNNSPSGVSPGLRPR